ncbi:Hypothetical predicted protein, partial [Marmota monax]
IGLDCGEATVHQLPFSLQAGTCPSDLSVLSGMEQGRELWTVNGSEEISRPANEWACVEGVKADITPERFFKECSPKRHSCTGEIVHTVTLQTCDGRAIEGSCFDETRKSTWDLCCWSNVGRHHTGFSMTQEESPPGYRGKAQKHHFDQACLQCSCFSGHQLIHTGEEPWKCLQVPSSSGTVHSLHNLGEDVLEVKLESSECGTPCIMSSSSGQSPY